MQGQAPIQKVDSIEFYAHELIRNQEIQVREKAFEYLNENLDEYLSGYADFKDTFPRYEGLAVLEDKDLQIRIITYQLYRDTSTYVYGGWVQSKNLEKPIYLSDESQIWEKDSDVDFMILDPANWYGALYYQMKVLSNSDNQISILLFGLDNYHFFTKRKVLDILVIQDSTVHFGKSSIEMEKGLPEDFWKKRFILDYSVQAPATLRYDQDREKIIFDHLIFMPSDIPEQRIMRVPDGTYSGFEIDKENQKLTYIEKIFDQVMEEAPGGRPKSGTKRDILGEIEKR